MKIGFVIMLILSINIMLYVGGVRVIEDNYVQSELYSLDANTDFMSKIINTSSTQTHLSSDFQNTVPDSFSESGDTSSILSFIDTLGAVKDFVVFLVNIIFTPIGIFWMPGLPWQIGLLIGLPLIFAGVMGIILFIRGIGG